MQTAAGRSVRSSGRPPASRGPLTRRPGAGADALLLTPPPASADALVKGAGAPSGERRRPSSEGTPRAHEPQRAVRTPRRRRRPFGSTPWNRATNRTRHPRFETLIRKRSQVPVVDRPPHKPRPGGVSRFSEPASDHASPAVVSLSAGPSSSAPRFLLALLAFVEAGGSAHPAPGRPAVQLGRGSLA